MFVKVSVCRLLEMYKLGKKHQILFIIFKIEYIWYTTFTDILQQSFIFVFDLLLFKNFKQFDWSIYLTCHLHIYEF